MHPASARPAARRRRSSSWQTGCGPFLGLGESSRIWGSRLVSRLDVQAPGSEFQSPTHDVEASRSWDVLGAQSQVQKGRGFLYIFASVLRSPASHFEELLNKTKRNRKRAITPRYLRSQAREHDVIVKKIHIEQKRMHERSDRSERAVRKCPICLPLLETELCEQG